MRINNTYIQVEEHPTLICCSYRLPGDVLFKRKYIGWGRRAAVAQFKRDAAQELKTPNMKNVTDEIHAFAQRATGLARKRLEEISHDEEATRLWRDEFWPGTRLSVVRERLQEAFVDLEFRRTVAYFRLHGRPVIATPVENLPVPQLTGMMSATLEWLKFLKTQREKRLVQDAIALRKGQINRERDWKRLPASVRKAALAAMETANAKG